MSTDTPDVECANPCPKCGGQRTPDNYCQGCAYDAGNVVTPDVELTEHAAWLRGVLDRGGLGGTDEEDRRLDLLLTAVAAERERADTAAVNLIIQRAKQAEDNWTLGDSASLVATTLWGTAHDLACGCEDSTVTHLTTWINAALGDTPQEDE